MRTAYLPSANSHESPGWWENRSRAWGCTRGRSRFLSMHRKRRWLSLVKENARILCSRGGVQNRDLPLGAHPVATLACAAHQRLRYESCHLTVDCPEGAWSISVPKMRRRHRCIVILIVRHPGPPYRTCRHRPSIPSAAILPLSRTICQTRSLSPPVLSLADDHVPPIAKPIRPVQYASLPASSDVPQLPAHPAGEHQP